MASIGDAEESLFLYESVIRGLQICLESVFR